MLDPIAREADILDRDFRRYIDACYQKYTKRTWTASGSGSALALQSGAAAGRDWFAVWDSATVIGWQESWQGQSTISNETTIECRVLWSDIVDRSNNAAVGLERVDDTPRLYGLLPGHVRELLAAYRLDGWRDHAGRRR